MDFGEIEISAKSSSRSAAQLASSTRYTFQTATDDDGSSNLFYFSEYKFPNHPLIYLCEMFEKPQLPLQIPSFLYM